MKLAQLATVGLAFILFISANYAYALTASPVKVEVTADAGQTLRGEIELLNEQSEKKVLFTSFENFEPAGDTGSPRFVGADDGLATWLQTQNSVTLEPGQKITVPYTITVPAGAEPGGYFAAVFFGEQDPATQEAGEVSIGGKLGILILLRVSGDIVENGGLSEFASLAGSRLFASLPIAFTYKFSNSGGDRVVPLGDIIIKNTFGMVSATLPANSNEGSVLPNSSRKFQAVWGEQKEGGDIKGFFAQAQEQLFDFHFGLYRAHVSVVYGTTNQTASDTLSFFIIPWQLLLLCGLLLSGVFFGIKKYNSWIISKSNKKS